jgi:hypothetical protein
VLKVLHCGIQLQAICAGGWRWFVSTNNQQTRFLSLRTFSQHHQLAATANIRHHISGTLEPVMADPPSADI